MKGATTSVVVAMLRNVREVHAYAGILLASVGAGVLWGVGAGILLAGLVLLYMGLLHRRPRR